MSKAYKHKLVSLNLILKYDTPCSVRKFNDICVTRLVLYEKHTI